jgi:hypothetical protein
MQRAHGHPGSRPNPTTERKGINAVEAIFINEFGWLFREQSVSDHDIDAHVEVVENSEPTGKLIALQIKTGQSYFVRQGNNYVYYGEPRHLRYWTNHSLPVFLILHDFSNNLTIWQKIEQHLVKVTDKGWSIKIPERNVLSPASKPFFSAGIANDEQSIRRFNMAMDLDLITLLAEKEEIYLEIEDWVNKTLNIRGISVMFDEPGKKEADLYIDPFRVTRGYPDLMDRYFPWLDYVHIETEETMSWEVEVHTLQVWVNDLGKSFIAVEEYFYYGRSAREEEWAMSDDADGERSEDDWE